MGELRRRGRLVELTERDTEREGLLDAMATPASRGECGNGVTTMTRRG